MHPFTKPVYFCSFKFCLYWEGSWLKQVWITSEVSLWHFRLNGIAVRTQQCATYYCQQYKNVEFYVLLTVHIDIILVNYQLDAQFLFSYMFIPNIHMFRALLSSSSGELIVSIRHLVWVTLCRWPSGVQVNLHRVTHTRCIDKTNSPDDEDMSARNM
jgi:hypothetical protein